jgi:hypothetical protein
MLTGKKIKGQKAKEHIASQQLQIIGAISKQSPCRLVEVRR